ncbi:MAG: efflux RND transporter periplasmic adaptor subunit [Pseudomonadales bacterium]|nr:efflux RND transporter periplasmic adaptor subunit [Halioglobus sp.]MCP5128069.1 efflux RND transporter periplasmic adaptor subunit [Pseudomonadales bacterium]
MQNKWIQRLLPIIVLAAAVIVAQMMIKSRSELPRHETAPDVPVVEVMVVEPGPVDVTVQSRGIVAARTNIELVSEVSGKVIWVAPEFLAGGAVSAGATLLRIDPIDYEVAVSVAKAAVASAKLSLAEVQVVLMRAAIEEAQAQVQASQDRLRQAESDLANTEIVAPFDAIIDSKMVDLGQYVQAGAPLMRLLGTSSVEIRLPLLASDVPFVRYGESADGTWPQATLTARFGNVERSWQARLVRIEQRVDEETRVFYLVAEVDAPYDTNRHPWPLSVGLFVEAQIEGIAIPMATRIPRSALHDGDSVYVVEAGKVQRREVTVVRKEQDSITIGEGLSRGDQVVLSRLEFMVDGMPVTVGQ